MIRRAATQARVSAATLLAFTFAATLILALSFIATRERIAANENAARAALIAQTLPAGSFDNDLVADTVPLTGAEAAALGLAPGAVAHVARKGGALVARVFEAETGRGYGGRIRLLVGVTADGRVSGVRVVAHKETPGLGDYIDRAKSSWADQLAGRGMETRWRVKKDGGDIDSVSGATISARAVTGAVGQAVGVADQLAARLKEQK
ncbi:RnfABCDGE type electron transport complex subunit G [Crenobacter intestini]|uniref:Ion-translocating oxidoreductase complex subunit G n=1 Tax=Crenobacter intestini TaxID=2563443 RepID=A0A4T0V7L9_9NEIS|nr:RnfABCDGE type electron transport complex subunit G [Crenobacter intestini]TIC87296.1 RnfABCDGE type electron transport complex subunit G [Crenobacter intestini]